MRVGGWFSRQQRHWQFNVDFKPALLTMEWLYSDRVGGNLNQVFGVSLRSQSA